MTLIFRRFRVVEALAQGGMGEIFLVDDVVNGGRAVLKVRRADVDHGAARFEHEVEVLRALDHPLIPRWLADGEWQGRRAVAVAYVEGLPLGQVMARIARPFAPRAVVAVGVDVLRALDHAHRLVTDDGVPRALVHRDVSPHNILVSPTGRAHLIDFGIATDVGFGEETATEVSGTPAYMAPEQASGQAIDDRADQFALGVVLWEMLAGTDLFGGESLESVWRKLGRCVIPALPTLPDLPGPMSMVVMRMLSVRPQDRFSSCAGAAEALSASLAPSDTAVAALLEEASAIAAVAAPVESTRPCRLSGRGAVIAL